jgi:hypothetical protein
VKKKAEESISKQNQKKHKNKVQAEKKIPAR